MVTTERIRGLLPVLIASRPSTKASKCIAAKYFTTRRNRPCRDVVFVVAVDFARSKANCSTKLTRVQYQQGNWLLIN